VHSSPSAHLSWPARSRRAFDLSWQGSSPSPVSMIRDLALNLTSAKNRSELSKMLVNAWRNSGRSFKWRSTKKTGRSLTVTRSMRHP
ncbi:hypothetical protein FOZ62_011083, partial [Perkinsus olseni]